MISRLSEQPCEELDLAEGTLAEAEPAQKENDGIAFNRNVSSDLKRINTKFLVASFFFLLVILSAS